MSDDFDYETYVKKHKANLLARFRSPDVGAFEDRYRRPLPPVLRQLYEFKDLLLVDSLIEIDTDQGTFVIQCFVPLTSESIQVNACYGWELYAFAAGPDGESLLISIEHPNFVLVDHQGEGSDIEETRMSLSRILKHLSNILVD